VITIHNPIATKDIELQSNQSFNFTDKYIISAGSLKNNIKQFDVLISCYLQSNLPNKSIKLIVMGDGVLLGQLKIATKRIDLQNNVVFVGQQNNPYIYFKNALFSVLTSKNEGFPMVLLESLACGTPVISFDCESGPSEIIDNELNGLLVENQNQQKMIFALNEMANNEKLYLHCKSNSKESVSGFSITKIGQQWLQIMK
jgi:N-acetylgalactosamine-N,N'-diacetylbacillosaminyl-diphospho-undecaprenol 4-alpha-N-acetylgalactosaminyltransferase